MSRHSLFRWRGAPRRSTLGLALLAGLLPAAADSWADHRHRARVAPPRPPAAAKPDGDAVVSEAWRHFSAGRDLVNAGRFSEGAAELRAARAAPAAAPADTDFYLGLAYDGLHQAEAALAAYRRFLQQHPDALTGKVVQERISLLELRRRLSALAVPALPPATPPPAAAPAEAPAP